MTCKDGYKEVRIGSKEYCIPINWKTTQLAEVANINMGSSPPSNTYNTIQNGLPFFQGNAEFSEMYPRAKKWCDEPQKIAEQGEILISVRAPVGDVNIAPFKCCIGRGLSSIDGIESESKYIYYFFKQFKSLLANFSQGSTFSSINKGVLENFIIPVPPLPEQKKIASILSSVDEAIEKTDQIIEENNRLKKGLMQKLLTKGIGHTEFKEVILNAHKLKIPVTWDVKQIRECAYTNESNLKSKTYKDYEIEYIDISSIEETGNIANTSFYKFDNAPSRAKRIVDKGDVLVSTVRPNLKTFAHVKIDRENLIASTGFAVLTPKQGTSGKYLYYAVCDDKFVNYLIRLMRGTNYPAVNNSDVKQTFIPLPPLPEQKKIATIISSVDAKIEKEKEYKEELESLKKGLMQKLLTGQVRVKINDNKDGKI